MSYKVTAPLVLAIDQGGHTHHVYQGGVIGWLSPEQAEHFLAENLVEKLEGGDESDDDRPKKTALKADWVDYAVADGYGREEVEAMSKSDIQALFD